MNTTRSRTARPKPGAVADARLSRQRRPRAAGTRVTVDPDSGEQRLSLPLPDPAIVLRLAAGLAGLLARLPR